ncbi:thioredoxin domain-containing protein [Daejeonella sp. H1SJ63]|uniref:thioredoxin domain-containing protein n=1 Tax=Daejeonella sp. H1SJ63 TaxID=3034145 RepID=UPI0023EDB70F|nr:thioredoxin domain-containing protein [Daejeonella sp. H1SJ63]
MPNRLINQSSPYLLQHANNPVDWFPWGEEALSKAMTENKLILVSIGYSACHWCHVMEHESFEDEEVAEIMNKYFVCIKIDREVRSDIDQIYMNAVQLMTGAGGWPLNCFCLPDQRPIYGGTYFRKNDWKNLLKNLAEFWKKKPDEAIEYAVRLTDGIQQSENVIKKVGSVEYTIQDLLSIFEPWKRSFDLVDGGFNRAPKFPMPNNWQFMLRYAHLMKDDAAHTAVRVTLQKMAFGGIYDQIGGGFARYSVDGKWHVPHFEKMLYDNAQLVSLYSEAYQYTPDSLYKDVVYESLAFIERELTSPEGGYYSALDADSEGVEGKFYTFTKSELIEILGDDADWFCNYYQVTEAGNWEEEHTNILMREFDDTEFASELGIDTSELKTKIDVLKSKVLLARSSRVRPGLDDKILAAWNGMMLKAYTDAYRVFGEEKFIEKALKNADFIFQKLFINNRLQRVYPFDNDDWKGAFLDDYAFIIEALIGLYEVTFEEVYLKKAKDLTDISIIEFYDQESGMFYYTSASGEQLIARKLELMDNVIPASNSVMANNLFKLGHFFDDQTYLDMSDQMLRNIHPNIKTYASAYSNWASLLMYKIFGLYEIAITGSASDGKRKEIEKYYIPNKILLGGTTGTLPLLNDKWHAETKVYVCRNKTCLLPVKEVIDAIKQIDNPSTTPGVQD